MNTVGVPLLRMGLKDWLWIPGTLSALEVDLGIAGSLVMQSIISAHVTQPLSTEVAWGQYVDRPSSRQVGLYGTSAAVAALRITGDRADLRERAINYLLRRHSLRQVDPDETYQFGLVAKLAGFLMAFDAHDLASNSEIASSCAEIVTALAAAQIPNQGWGYDLHATTSETICTSLVLLAIEHVGLGSRLTGRLSAIDWETRRVAVGYAAMRPADLGLALLTLCSLEDRQGPGGGSQELGRAHKYFLRQLRASLSAWDDYFVSYTVPAQSGSAIENDEYFVIHSGLVALQYLAQCKPADFVRPYVLTRLRAIVTEIRRNDMHLSLNSRASTRANASAIQTMSIVHRSLNGSRATLILRAYLATAQAILSRNALIYAAITFLILMPYLGSQAGNLALGVATSLAGGIAANWITR